MAQHGQELHKYKFNDSLLYSLVEWMLTLKCHVSVVCFDQPAVQGTSEPS